MRTKIIVLFLSSFLFVILSCTRREMRSYEYRSLKALVVDITTNINQGNFDYVTNRFIPREVFIEELYPEWIEDDRSQPLPPDVYWRTFKGLKRIAFLGEHIQEYRGHIKKVVKIGKEEKKVEYPRHTVLKRVPVTVEVQRPGMPERQWILTGIAGQIIVRDGYYSLLEIMEDKKQINKKK